MFFSKKDKILVTTLKGRISKILGVSTKLSSQEKKDLVTIYNNIDKFLVGKNFETLESFKLSLEECSSENLEKSNKKYIKESILPLIHSLNSTETENE